MTITFSCPLFVKPCQSSLVALSCPYRQICPENCVINGDDAFQNNNGQQSHRCDNTDDDAYFQQQADDAA
eukprot:CAMPEP_0202465894 /NCGR_PEP_ID=MMETSP1360-20130828/66999_1 /ASSEMBLY_ACC=CAM_ASM_000848 /TAXON_ID=515479 /ORGANISM="Licmophora paradoxa, Strain CCMP2313" /LENGTH=69 /DNA_ID=CAMNT_0049089827 /DNA_START=40 /DNA_END=245 /DNA_ORIENTATION=+